jgi:hypothetical protein
VEWLKQNWQWLVSVIVMALGALGTWWETIAPNVRLADWVPNAAPYLLVLGLAALALWFLKSKKGAIWLRLKPCLTRWIQVPWEYEHGDWEQLGHRSQFIEPPDEQTPAIAWPVPDALPITWMEVEVQVPEDANGKLVRAGIDVMGPNGGGQVARLLVASDGRALMWHRGSDGHQQEVPYERECEPGEWHELRLERTTAGFTYGINGHETTQRMERWPPRVRLRLHTSCWPGGEGVAYYKNLRYG